MSQYTRNLNKFEYHAEDTSCEYCLYWKRKSKHRRHDCMVEPCCCDDIRQDAIMSGRIKRKRGWDNWAE
jgi:hypothetical protein